MIPVRCGKKKERFVVQHRRLPPLGDPDATVLKIKFLLLNNKWLQISKIWISGFQSGVSSLHGQVSGGNFQSGGSGIPSLQLIGSEKFHVHLEILCPDRFQTAFLSMNGNRKKDHRQPRNDLGIFVHDH